MEIKDLKQHIKDLMTAMGRTGTKRLVIKHEDFELELERAETCSASFRPIEHLHPSEKIGAFPESGGRPLPISTTALPHDHVHFSNEKPSAPIEEGGSYITSPMVGTFYTASSPTSAPFVKVGDVIGKHDIVCIIEAMKVMNEIKADISGTIVEILVANGDPVEFGTKLFRVK